MGDTYRVASQIVARKKTFPYLFQGKARQLVFLTMVFGYYNKYLRPFLRRARSLGIHHLIVYCMDEEAQRICLEFDPAACIPGRPSMLNKFAASLVFLNMDIDVFYLDFDVYLLQNPTSHILSRLSDTHTEMLVSATFGDDCICSGLIFFRATDSVREWLFLLLSWMYEHVHTHDQQIFSAFLYQGDVENVTRSESVSKDPNFRRFFLPLLPVPRWATLDPVVQFASAATLNVTGWTGELEDMLIFHFLHGDSELNLQHASHLGTKTKHSAEKLTLGDIFYGEPMEYYERESPLTQDMVDALQRSRRDTRPKLVHCSVTGERNVPKGIPGRE